MDAKLFASKPELIEAEWSSVVVVVVMGTKAREPIGSDPNKSISRLLTADATGIGTDADGAPTGAAEKEPRGSNSSKPSTGVLVCVGRGSKTGACAGAAAEAGMGTDTGTDAGAGAGIDSALGATAAVPFSPSLSS
jgi:hypothetical protein